MNANSLLPEVPVSGTLPKGILPKGILPKGILPIILNLMFSTQKSGLTGIDKKEFVLNSIKSGLLTETYEKYQPILSIIIDLLKLISKNQKVLEGLKKFYSKNLFSCIR